ncbi:MAG TPA: hypothetical protein ENJ73_00670 [Desulfobacterales bacterium]|nr:hypothetical protein [Desulfobacterales bacterium]
MSATITIECLFAPGCSSRDHTLELARRVAADFPAVATVRETTIATPEEAARLHFLGSPSVRVNGRDIEPGAEDRADFGLG